jgi:hypothetical protein
MHSGEVAERSQRRMGRLRVHVRVPLLDQAKPVFAISNVTRAMAAVRVTIYG